MDTVTWNSIIIVTTTNKRSRINIRFPTMQFSFVFKIIANMEKLTKTPCYYLLFAGNEGEKSSYRTANRTTRKVCQI